MRILSSQDLARLGLLWPLGLRCLRFVARTRAEFLGERFLWLADVAEQKVIHRNPETLPDTLRNLYTDRPFARFERIIVAFGQAKFFGKGRLLLKAELFPHGNKTPRHILIVGSHRWYDTTIHANCRFACCEP